MTITAQLNSLLCNGPSRFLQKLIAKDIEASGDVKAGDISLKTHKHGKADITDFPTSIKNPQPFVVKLNGGTTEGTNQFAYDGSTLKNLNITPASIGAAKSATGGPADSAVKLDSSAGSSTQPIYFSGGKPVACSYSLAKSVPSNALFTDTVYTHPSSGVVTGTYRSVTVNSQGHVTAGTNPTTLAGYGITDAAQLGHTHNYAGSSSAGGAANSTAGTITVRVINNGTATTYTFNGSANKEIVLSSDSLGFLPITGGTVTGDLTVKTGSIPTITIANSAGNDAALVFDRGTSANWRILNQGGNLLFQNDWNGAKGNYFTSLILNHTSGDAQVQGAIHATGIMSCNGYLNPSGGISTRSNNTVSATTQDTTSKWGEYRSSVHFYSQSGCITDQPSQYGYLINVGQSSEQHQLWLQQSSGSIFHRGGNAQGWNGSWRTILDSGNYTSYANCSNLGAMRAISANGYYGMADPSGNASNWIRTTSNGIIPYQSGGSGEVGTSSWQFNKMHSNTFYSYGSQAFVANNNHAISWGDSFRNKGAAFCVPNAGSSTGFNTLASVRTSAGAYSLGALNSSSAFYLAYATNAIINGTDNAKTHAWEFNTAGSFKAEGEIISTSANGFRIAYGGHGFIIRNDGGNAYFMSTNNTDPYGSYSDYYSSMNLSDGLFTFRQGLDSLGSITVPNSNIYIGGSTRTSVAQCRVQNNTNSAALYVDNNAGVIHSSGTSGYGTTKWLTSITTGGSVSPSSSDRRLKDDLGLIPEEEALTLLKEVPIHNFVYKTDKDRTVQNGIIAQELRDILKTHGIGNRPYLMFEYNSADDMNIYHDINAPETDDMSYSIDYSKFTPLLWKGWQLHEEKLEKALIKINQLEEELKALRR